MKTPFLLVGVAASLLAFAPASRAEHKFKKFSVAMHPYGVSFGVARKGFRAGFRIGHFSTCVPGHYDVRPRRVWHPPYSERIWVEPVYSYRWAGGCRVRVLVRAGYYESACRPGYFEVVEDQVWVPEVCYGH